VIYPKTKNHWWYKCHPASHVCILACKRAPILPFHMVLTSRA